MMLALRRQGQENHWEFETSLIYIASSILARYLVRPFLKQTEIDRVFFHESKI